MDMDNIADGASTFTRIPADGGITKAVAELEKCANALKAIDTQIDIINREHESKLNATKAVRESAKADWIQARDRVKELLFPTSGKRRGPRVKAQPQSAPAGSPSNGSVSTSSGTAGYNGNAVGRAPGVAPLQLKILRELDSAGCPIQLTRLAQLVGSSVESVRTTCKTLKDRDDIIATDINTYKIVPNGSTRYRREKHLI